MIEFFCSGSAPRLINVDNQIIADADGQDDDDYYLPLPVGTGAADPFGCCYQFFAKQDRVYPGTRLVIENHLHLLSLRQDGNPARIRLPPS